MRGFALPFGLTAARPVSAAQAAGFPRRPLTRRQSRYTPHRSICRRAAGANFADIGISARLDAALDEILFSERKDAVLLTASALQSS
ncbi:MAG: hypothetical protein EA404_14335 [Spirochaetaceae bacterium]|nr:MAG: hypothetical protein EA404_14335 [Spirochaetaceae bacterium]